MAKRTWIGWMLAVWLAPLPLFAASADERELLVFAAASLTDALEEIGAEYREQKKAAVGFSFAASSTLARQIEAGAPAEVFFSADQEWMDYLQSRGRLDASSRHDVVANRLVLIAPHGSDVQLEIAPNFPLIEAMGRGRLATGDPDIVPVGRYARSALTALGVWGVVENRLVRADNVRTALAFVARGEAPLGIVYETDALVEKRVRIIDVFPASTHSPIVYPVAIVKDARPAAAQFVSFLDGPIAQGIFKKYGFLPIVAARPPGSNQ